MQIVSTIKEVRDIVKQWRKEDLSIGYVPTMGYLHEGHASLMKAARKENDKVVVSIFVNPMQFGPTEDLDSYPRDLEKDSKLCEAEGVDLIFHPEPEEMYDESFCSFTDINGLSNALCGLSRPIHFRGVCTVLNKFFNIVGPDRAYFGQKDAQQAAIVKQFVKDLNIPVEIIRCPIIREADGLAKSSRNTYLSAEERQAALCLSKAIFLGEDMVKKGENDAKKVTDAMIALIKEEPLADIEYVKAVNGLTMKDVEVIKAPTLVAMAVRIGTTRLIDNFVVE
ncbi:MAG: pantoate--beta-alanine ligase [Lachnospiraceae bacterium]|jgi:pantoate--beta-alanine ligase|nr:pantoate--beta-alanine ligase [Lachnospiraceae bacterium]